MLERILEYVSGWSPGLHSGVFRELGLTVSSKPEHWYAAFERHVALGRPSNDGVSAYATKHTQDISILTWNLRASQSGRTSGHDLLQAQLQVLLQGLSRPTILCLQEVCLAMVEQLPEHGYDVLSCDLVYAEVGKAEGTLSLTQIADKMKRTKYRPAFSGFNVIAVLRTFRLNGVAGCCLSLEKVLHDYPPKRDSEGAVLERRMLSAVDLTFANQTRPLRIYNTHLHATPGASGLNERYREMEIICEQLTQQPQPAGVTAPVTGGRSSSTAAAAAASSSSSSSPAILAAISSSPSPPPFVLCGDLNACSERDYTPGEQYMMYTFSGLNMCQEINYWGALELLETHAIDSFALAQQPRPKISCWSCRRVDHIVVNTQAAMRGRILHSAVYYTLASDHLPVVCWMQEEQSQAQTQCPGSR